ncbi:GMC family oxidoreductase [Acetobacteraceae bacterium KSS8]|uniref:GMC family oxidoreductase n=1 Tax=Endosaccharibacter trunci TaxID=2812733 RepID=A0ABT1WB33_9PROT|nr:GMC family oxidoreductase [Acetobacteraceae bacterium KSS8]
MMRRFAPNETVDVVVVGTGAGAGPLLARFAAAGLSIVALEAGRFRNPKNFTPDELGSPDLYWMGERLSAGETPEAFGSNNSGIGVGGSTLHWGAFTPRPDPREFRLRSETGQGEDWPLSVAELLPFIERVERDIGVSGPSHYPWDAGRSYAMPPVALNAPAQKMQRGCAALGIVTANAPAAVLTRARSGRSNCRNCGACHQGCRNDAKASTANTYIPEAIAGGAEIRTGCMAVDIEQSADGRVRSIVYRKDGVLHSQKCRALFLCAGAVETPRLLLHSEAGNSNGQVGRNYMAHIATQVWGSFDDEMRMNKGYPSSLMTEDFLRPKDADFASGYLIQSLGVMPATWANAMGRGREIRGQALTNALLGYNRAGGIGINGDCLPSDGNHLTLSDEVDESGMRKPLVTFSYGANETAMDAHALRTMRQIWEAAGATDIWVAPRSAHTIGTCRMGGDPDRNVVDGVGRSHEIDNLWICDNSTFPSAMAANPALTQMALSLRTAEAFLAS